MSMPDEVPIFTAKDMLIGPESNADGTCGCMAYWRWELFKGANSKEVLAARRMACSDLQIPSVTFYGDRVTRAQAARAMNRTTAYLGYVVGNPECTRSGKLRPVK
jgi:hypothetical protein